MSTQRVGTVTIEGLSEVLSAFDEFGAYGKKNAKKAVLTAAHRVRTDAIQSIKGHESKGIVYQKTKPKRTHTASDHHHPPNSDTGVLARSIRVISLDGGFNAAVGSSLDYAYYLEFGTRRIVERPWLYPAMRRNTQFFINLLQAGLIDAAVEAGFQRGRLT